MVHWLKHVLVMVQEQKAARDTHAEGLRRGIEEAKDQTKYVVTRLKKVQAAKKEAMQVGFPTLIVLCCSDIWSCSVFPVAVIFGLALTIIEVYAMLRLRVRHLNTDV